jgi:leader peptidase (prepilin peptidase) / N-methyltransferase
MSALELLRSDPAFFVGTCVVLGLAIGSFLNVVIYRLPVMLERQWREQCLETLGPQPPTTAPPQEVARFDLIVPRSRCPACGTAISAWQNIPLISWLILRGRCARCGVRISARYPLIEALTGILSGIVAQQMGFGWPAVAALVLTWFLIALAVIDIDHQLLPDDLTLPLLWLGLFFSLWHTSVQPGSLPIDTRTSVIGAVAGYGSLWSVYHLFRLITGKDGMGYGDFKLLAALGAWLGWQMLLPIVLLAAATGAVLGVLLIALHRQHRSAPIPFGPFLAGAGWLVLLWGPRMVNRYLGLFPLHP